MSRTVCSQCGAPLLDDSKFCSHCGAKVDDGIFRAEIKIDEVAENRRADYETQESALRQKQMKSDLRRNKVRWILIGLVGAIGVALFISAIVSKSVLVMVYGMLAIVYAGYLAIKAAFRK